MELTTIQKRTAALLLAMFVVQPLEAAEVTLEILLFDRKGLLGECREPLEDEVERILGTAGIRVKWLPAGEILERSADRLPLRATLVEREADYLRLANGVMGVTSGKGNDNIFIFYPAILRTLQGSSSARPGPPKLEARLRARAIGRVLVHELVHFLCPKLPHAESGLMKAHWTRRLLVEPGVRLDPASRDAVAQVMTARLATLVKP